MSSKGCLAQARNWLKKTKEYIYICMQTKGLVKCFSELGNIYLEAFPFNEIVLGGESHTMFSVSSLSPCIAQVVIYRFGAW